MPLPIVPAALRSLSWPSGLPRILLPGVLAGDTARGAVATTLCPDTAEVAKLDNQGDGEGVVANSWPD